MSPSKVELQPRPSHCDDQPVVPAGMAETEEHPDHGAHHVHFGRTDRTEFSVTAPAHAEGTAPGQQHGHEQYNNSSNSGGSNNNNNNNSGARAPRSILRKEEHNFDHEPGSDLDIPLPEHLSHRRRSLRLSPTHLQHGHRRATYTPTSSRGSLSQLVAQHRRESISTAGSHGSVATDYEWYSELTDAQMAAARETLYLLDTSTPGNLDLDQLYSTLKPLALDAGVTRQEVYQVMQILSKDSDRLEFGDFLYALANIEEKEKADIEPIEKSSRVTVYTHRQGVLYTAIAVLSMREAAKSIGDIERYYSMKRRLAPEVLSHYTAGARLIGLTERQLTRHMSRLHKAFKLTDEERESPYAKPLPFVASTPQKKLQSSAGPKIAWGAKKEGDRVGKAGPAVSVDGTSPASGRPRTAPTTTTRQGARVSSGRAASAKSLRKPNVSYRLHRANVPLPAMPSSEIVTFDDLSDMRKKASAEIERYYQGLRRFSVEQAKNFSEKLVVEDMPDQLLDNYHQVSKAYLPQRESEAFVIAPWVNTRNSLFIRYKGPSRPRSAFS
ncbi:Hypp1247 [Branchiostoma lanceolatum]|uniref:Hypp1247 protein n=1 Tax=Branchiostoma lanceolatum TaxID=7740 RepID=A0A8K0EHU3_BRALA|nr:Hypp1247 [Branchiostoma lanceolatum]